MKTEEDGNITFAWWNTSLSPSAKSRATEDDLKVALSVIEYMIVSSKVDFIALGEISEKDIEKLKSSIEIYGYELRGGVSKVGRSKFDTCYIFNTQKIFISDLSNVVSRRGGGSLKVAQKLDLVIEGFEFPVHVFVSHWPSRLWCNENDAERHNLGIRLRDEVEELISLYSFDPYIVLLGDYNDEPFDKSLSDQVMATRDINLAKKKSHLLYNPFWKHLSARPFDIESSGSYYYKSGKLTQWHTFDQIIFSHAFLTSKEWGLCEKSDFILSIPGYVETVKNNNSIFDHLPVSGRLVRTITHG